MFNILYLFLVWYDYDICVWQLQYLVPTEFTAENFWDS